MQEKVAAALDKIRPALWADGGDAELVSVKDGVVTIRFTISCNDCPVALDPMTLRINVEGAIRQEVPEVKKLVAV